MKKLSCILAVLVIATLSAAAPSIPAQGTSALSKFLTDATGRGDVPGVVVTVVNRDGVLYHDAFGKSSTLRNAPMAKDTIFNIASMTKAVTSVAIMMLVDEGKLKLDDDVAKYLPKYKDPLVISKFNSADGSYETRPAKRPITIRHLLTHTSGIGYGFASQTVTTLSQKTGKTELDLPLLFDPGDGWAYGASTRVLGHVVEAISGQKIDAFLDARILKPLGMHDTGYAVPQSKNPRVVAVNTRGNDGKFVERPMPATIASPVQGDGGLYSTASDYGLFLRMLLNRGRLGNTRILSEKSARSVFDNHTGKVVVQRQISAAPALSRDFPVGAGEDNWGLGFQLAKARRPNMRTPGSGTWAGIFNTHFFIDPAREIGVVVMMQTLPFYDDASMTVYAGVEEIVYRNLK
ncbi:MAG TPA: serine hydrolase domain-containing protein [Vicinamibacterales bacterium]|nr:serine hydrolase domain-containing protein [Vicinamibacterales bacterium]